MLSTDLFLSDERRAGPVRSQDSPQHAVRINTKQKTRPQTIGADGAWAQNGRAGPPRCAASDKGRGFDGTKRNVQGTARPGAQKQQGTQLRRAQKQILPPLYLSSNSNSYCSKNSNRASITASASVGSIRKRLVHQSRSSSTRGTRATPTRRAAPPAPRRAPSARRICPSECSVVSVVSTISGGALYSEPARSWCWRRRWCGGVLRGAADAGGSGVEGAWQALSQNPKPQSTRRRRCHDNARDNARG